MKPETDPITEDEWLLRRGRVEQFRTDQLPTISPNAFEPRLKGRDIDDKGISLYRQVCLSSPDDILATVEESKRHEYFIVRIPVALLITLDLSVSNDPDPVELDRPRILGHVVIPELNATAYKADKASFAPIKLRLAEVASEEGNILRAPRVSSEDC